MISMELERIIGRAIAPSLRRMRQTITRALSRAGQLSPPPRKGGARHRHLAPALDGGTGTEAEPAVVSERCQGCAYLEGHHPSCKETRKP